MISDYAFWIILGEATSVSVSYVLLIIWRWNKFQEKIRTSRGKK